MGKMAHSPWSRALSSVGQLHHADDIARGSCYHSRMGPHKLHGCAPGGSDMVDCSDLEGNQWLPCSILHLALNLQ